MNGEDVDHEKPYALTRYTALWNGEPRLVQYAGFFYGIGTMYLTNWKVLRKFDQAKLPLNNDDDIEDWTVARTVDRDKASLNNDNDEG